MKRVPLSRHDILNKVELFQNVPDSIPKLHATLLAKFLGATKADPDTTGVVAVWPDGTWAALAHDSDWAQPRPFQLLRAYHSAFSAGINISNTSDDQLPPPKQGLIVNITDSK